MIDEIKKEFYKLEPEIDSMWVWIEKTLNEAYHRGFDRGYDNGYEHAEKSLPSYNDAVEEFIEALENKLTNK